ncbi:6704a158-f84d-4936-94ec-6d6eaf9b9b71 [Sclerotinia trifoliorum]|uniref:6704a158-f84d-4936-94ec-6d6eaf9b9b71 n=1 Tax=Sclerotinia trifoliorum TaxID=28548 RepID=A0A8H2ZKF5_9HELO|nr:6704a158-f84d-4936-94ec-6d6eaf9b9b71 [Sclerotinia trifoliorum]
MSCSSMSIAEPNTIRSVIKLQCAKCQLREKIPSDFQLKLQPQWRVFQKEVEKEFLRFEYVKYDQKLHSPYKDYEFMEFKCHNCASTDNEKKFCDFARIELPQVFIEVCRGYLETEQKGVEYERESAVRYLKSISHSVRSDIHKAFQKEWKQSFEKGKGRA